MPEIGISKRMLRLFALSWGGMSAVAAYLLRSAGGGSVFWLLPAALALAFFAGLFVPAAMRGPYRLVERLFQPVGKFFALLTLGIVYFGLFTPFALALRLFGWDPLRLRHGRRKDSAWVGRDGSSNKTNYDWQY